MLEPERVSKWDKQQSLAWYPHAKIYDKHMITRGKYAKGPQGAVIHWTSGHSDGRGSDAIAYGTKMGHCYLVNDYQGQIHQAHPLDQWGYHAGQSYWPGLGSGVSDNLIGIETMCAGKLKEKNGLYYPDWPNSKPIITDKVRKQDQQDNCAKGAYEVFSHAQIESLVTFLLWCKDNFPNFSFDYVLGHDQVSPGRKTDPGWSLPYTMNEFQQILKDKYEHDRASA